MFKEWKGIIRKADLVLLFLILVSCAATSVWAYRAGDTGAVVRVEVDGAEYGTYLLEEDQVIEIRSDYGTNQLTIQDGKAFMSEASCPDQYCLEQHRSEGGISRSNQTLICLPNRVVVSVSGGSSEDTDGIDVIAGSPEQGKDL